MENLSSIGYEKMRENTYTKTLFVSVLFGIIWGTAEILIILMRGRVYNLSEDLLSRLAILLSYVLSKMFISFVVGIVACLISIVFKKFKLTRKLFNLRFLCFISFAAYCFLYYTVRIFMPHGHLISFTCGLLGALFALSGLYLVYYLSSHLSEKFIHICVKAVSLVATVILSVCVTNFFLNYNKEIDYYDFLEKGFESSAIGIEPKYNVVFIIADTLGQDRLNAFGYERKNTPFISEFSKNCIVADNYRSVASATSESTASIFTGKYPADAGIHKNRFLNDDNITAGECFKSVGYNTSFVSTNVLASGEYNYDQGFNNYSFNNSAQASWVYNEFLKIIDKSSSSPFFIYLHFMEPHTPYAIEDRFIDNFINDDYTKKMPYKFGIYQSSNYGGYAGDPSPDRRYGTQGQYIALYDTTILQFDYYFEKIVRALKEREIFDNTIIVFSSDHGEFMGDWNLFCTHGATPYASQINVPLLIKYNGVYLKFDELMENRNIFKVIIDLIKHEPADSNGIKEILSKHCNGYAISVTGQIQKHKQAFSIQNKKYKYIYNPKGISVGNLYTLPELFWPWRIRELLLADHYFNYLYKDQYYILPDETSVHLGLPVKEDFAVILKKGIASTAKKPKGEEEVIDEETMKKLRTLGYLE